MVRCLAAEAGLGPRQTYRLRLAAEELFTNIVRHGYGPDATDARVVVEGGLTEDDVWIRLVDTAAPFDPFRRPKGDGRDLSPAEDGPPTLGLYLARLAVDYASYVHDAGANSTRIAVSRTDLSDDQELQRWDSPCV